MNTKLQPLLTFADWEGKTVRRVITPASHSPSAVEAVVIFEDGTWSALTCSDTTGDVPSRLRMALPDDVLTWLTAQELFDAGLVDAETYQTLRASDLARRRAALLDRAEELRKDADRLTQLAESLSLLHAREPALWDDES